MNNNKSGKFFVGSLIIFLVLFGVVLMVLSNMQQVGKNVTAPASMEPEAIAERIKPVAEVNVGEAPVVEAPAAAPVEETAGGPGQQIVTAVCATCHASGLMQAPKIGSGDDWGPRLDKGIETLYTHAINGFNTMPARGGKPDLTDDEVKAAVNYMLAESGLSAGNDTPAAAPEAAAEPVANDAEPAAEPAAAAAPAAEDNVQGEQVVTAVCAMCHASGLMQAPKIGSAEDWAPRIEKGMETLYTHAINGFNTMPAKGGRGDLSDEEVKAAVDYMVAGAQ